MKSLLFFSVILLSITPLSSQEPFSLQLLAQAPDTASNVFSQNKCFLRFKEQIPFIPETLTPQYDIKFLPDSSFLTVKFPNSEWIRFSEYEVAYYAKTPQKLYTSEYNNIYIELISIFGRYPDLFEYAKAGCNVNIRFQLYVSIDGSAYHYLYSNIETMYLPPATSDDIQAFQYIREKFKDISRFAYFKGIEFAYLEDAYYLKEQFPNSIISELAYKTIIDKEYLTKFWNGGGGSSELNLWLKDRYKLLLSSKSDLIRDRVNKLSSHLK